MKRIIYFLLTLLGFGAVACESQNLVEYGCPYADFHVSARVVDSEHNPIAGIEVSQNNYTKYGLTDAEGNISFDYQGMSLDTILFTDVDGEANGGEFESVEMNYNDYDHMLKRISKGEGWYSGEFELNLGDVELKLKSESEEEANN